MSSVYCSQGHQNTLGSRFCSWCGEKLPLAQQGYQGVLLGDRYRIVQQLGYGGFGRTYLAEDLHRFNEPCVLKEFAPQVQGSYALQKAEELFEREAGVLHQLQHPQIPRFRELFRTHFEHKDRLFLVQDFVEGQTYRQVLDARRAQGQCFSEAEVVQLMRDLLPVLHYIHGLGVVHRDISPDNLIWRQADQRPVLIDFGGVKQVAASVASQYLAPGQVVPSTRVGKVGYAPDEQLLLGKVSPQSDLYALAVTVLVLLTGREPAELGDIGSGLWQQQVSLSPLMQQILSRMLAAESLARYGSAEAVMQALQGADGVEPERHTIAPMPYGAAGEGHAGTEIGTVVHAPRPVAPQAKQSDSGWSVVLTVVVLLVGAGGGAWWLSDRWLPFFSDGSSNPSPTPSDPAFSTDEQARKQALSDRHQALGVDFSYLIALTNQTFYARYPELDGRRLSKTPEDAVWRERWDVMANDWLDLLERELSAEARRKLGGYGRGDRDRWKQAVNQLNVSSRALNDLTDARFFHLFPEWRGQEGFIDKPIGQVWQAIAADQVDAMQAGQTLQRLEFASGEYSTSLSERLTPGEGMIYIANLSQGQLMRLNVNAAQQAMQLSIYLPRPTNEIPFLLDDSDQMTWSGKLPQSGFYEIVVVNTKNQAMDYGLDLAVDNITTTPANTSDDASNKVSDDALVEPGQGNRRDDDDD